MAIQVGDKIPSVVLKKLDESGLKDQSTDEIFKNRNVVLFGVPGAFSPTCSLKHLPGYIENLPAFKELGIDVVCMAVNDPFVMSAWTRFAKAEEITMLADGNATFTKALGLRLDGTSYGLGQRCQRFALYAENGIVKIVAVEKPGAFEVSDAEEMLKAVRDKKAAD